MSLLKSITTGKTPKPRRTVIYGVGGVGKSTWAAKWPKPIFIQTEDGAADIDVAKFPRCENVVDAYNQANELANGGHDFKTVVLDSADWLERLLWEKVCERDSSNPKSIADIDYAKGYSRAASMFSDFLSVLDICRFNGMNIVIIAHSVIFKFKTPGDESYDRYGPKMHNHCSSMLVEWADEVLFCNYKTHVRDTDEGFGAKRGVGVGDGERVMFCHERPAHIAKNRLGLPEEMTLDFDEYSSYLTMANAKK